ncbi:hypothetical protein LOK46_31495 (plasmid) [Methylobacterium sp. NMS14P]|uniref:hypothetical protein n=1 Tax=Methylobacterium sp. NMS14P TaxID=2894310 RepID=UPI0023591670|nr:hypothetical protein [Methylobacterium sp. NMS14P]WCS28444.1 hypothetical protein LOK46_31495 [Methylobacterium sp. NMS14P]
MRAVLKSRAAHLRSAVNRLGRADFRAPRAGEAEDPVARIRDFPRARGRSIPLNVALSPAIDSAGRARTPFARIYTDIINIIEIIATL